MYCTQGRLEADTGGESPPDEQLQAGLAQQVSDRQSAVMYLKAAGQTDDAVTRDLLRRRGVELLLRPRRSSLATGLSKSQTKR